MTDLQFLQALQERLENYEQVLVRAELDELRSATLDFASFIEEHKGKIKPGRDDLSELSRTVSGLYRRSCNLIQAGLDFYHTMVLSFYKNETDVTYDNAKIPAKKQPAQQQRLFDVSV